MVKTLGPLFSLPAGLPIRKRRNILLPIEEAPPGIDSIIVEEWTPNPSEDLSGSYVYNMDYNDKRLYSRGILWDYICYFSNFYMCWLISNDLNEQPLDFYKGSSSLKGTYIGTGGNWSGKVIVS
jgi:hypothetical protein